MQLAACCLFMISLLAIWGINSGNGAGIVVAGRCDINLCLIVLTDMLRKITASDISEFINLQSAKA